MRLLALPPRDYSSVRFGCRTCGHVPTLDSSPLCRDAVPTRRGAAGLPPAGVGPAWSFCTWVVLGRTMSMGLGTLTVSIAVSIRGGKSTTFLPRIPGNRAVCQQPSGMVPYFSPSHERST